MPNLKPQTRKVLPQLRCRRVSCDSDMTVLTSLTDTEEGQRPMPGDKTFFLFINTPGPGQLLRLLI